MMRSALVTGGSSGIGLAIATALAADGYGVTITGRRIEKLRQADRALSDADVLLYEGNISGPDAAVATIDAHRARFGGLDVLVANAGASRWATVSETDPDTLRRILAVHVEAAFALTRTALPLLRRSSGPDLPPAWVILTSSIAAHFPVAGFAAYSAAKAALAALARSINAEEAANEVRSCALCPAFVDTPLTNPIHGEVPAEAMLRPEDMAAAVRFLLALSPTAVVSELVIERTGAGPLAP